MKKISRIWTLAYKEKDSEPLAFSYDSEKEALLAKSLVDESNGSETINDQGQIDGYIEIEWCYLIHGHIIKS